MIHISEPTYKYLGTSNTYCLHYRGNINIKVSAVITLSPNPHLNLKPLPLVFTSNPLS